MGIYRLGIPHPVFKAECSVCQCTYRTHINHVSNKFIIQRLLNIGSNLCMVASVQYTVVAVTSHLVGGIHTTIAKDTACHVQLDIRSQINALKRASLELITCSLSTMLIA